VAQETDFGPLLRAWFRGWSDTEYESLLWRCTSWPFGFASDVREQLRKLRIEVIWGATLEQLMEAAAREQAAAIEGA
jgi:hypothetical protein